MSTIPAALRAIIAATVIVLAAGCSNGAAPVEAAPVEAAPPQVVVPTDPEDVADKIERAISDQLPSDRRTSCIQWEMSSDQEKQAFIEQTAASNFGDITALTDEQKEAIGTGMHLGFMRGCA